MLGSAEKLACHGTASKVGAAAAGINVTFPTQWNLDRVTLEAPLCVRGLAAPEHWCGVLGDTCARGWDALVRSTMAQSSPGIFLTGGCIRDFLAQHRAQGRYEYWEVFSTV